MLLMSKKDSIYFQLFRLLAISAAAVIVFFLIISNIGDRAVETYYYNSGYEEKMDKKYLDKLQTYVTENNISTRDTEELKQWVKKQKIIALRIYMDDQKVFDSDYPDEELWEEDIRAREYDWETYYSVDFSDGTARIGLAGLYEYHLYNISLIMELVCSFGLFFLLVLLGIRKKMKYISKLSNEIAILEGGSLDYAITVQGKDELSILAEGLDNMRKSFQDMIEQEAQMVNENNKIITEMSHDLRTPVTSMMLYTEILRKGNYKGKEQFREYLDKIDKKAHRMKQLTDHLFEYALVSGEQEIELENPENCEVLFYDLFSETCSYLNQNGFDVDFKVEWPEKNIRVYTEYIVRILDNISSNIIKYADPQNKVIISSVYTGQTIGFRFENTENKLSDKNDSNGVGLQSIRNMMKKMGGACRISNENGIFGIEIVFPCINN